MKLIKRILIGLLVLIALLLIAAAFMPKSFQVQHSKEIATPASFLYNLADDHSVAKLWNPWVQEDTSMVLTMGDKTKGVGGEYSWSSEAMGTGKAKFIEAEKNKKIKAEIFFDGNGPNYYTLDFTPSGDKTNVTWTMDSEMSWPFNLMAPFIKGSVKKSYVKGLNNLEKVALTRMNDGVYNGIKINESEIEERYYVLNRAEVPFDKMGTFFGQNLGPMFQTVQEAGLSMAGMPSGLVFKWDEANGKADMAAAIPISEETSLRDLKSTTLPASPVLEVIYEGDVANSQVAHAAIDAYMADRGILFNYPVVEEYITDPGKVSDPSKTKTRILYYYNQ